MSPRDQRRLIVADLIVGDIRDLMADVRNEVRIKLEAEKARYKASVLNTDLTRLT